MSENIINVLLVEDNLMFAHIIQTLLADSQSPVFKVIPVETLSEAIEVLSDGEVDLVLLNLMLPDSQALDTFFRIKARALDVPIVIQSGPDDVAIAAKAVREGAYDYLVKDQITGVSLLRSIRCSIESARTSRGESNVPELDEFRYEFYFSDGSKEIIVIQLKKPELSIVINPEHKGEAWTKLDNHKCPNCPLSSDSHEHCPIAFNLTDVVKIFAKYKSHEEVDVHIISPTREYRQRVPIAEGLSSLLGMYMVTSGCPVMDLLRPMVYTHLPFATANETMYRAISMYLMAQHFKQKKGLVFLQKA